ncbi:MAG: DUF4931 domain-containing protein [Candidatus Micrarchaeota archaeon]
MVEFVLDESKSELIISNPKRSKRPKLTHGEKKPNPFAKGSESLTPPTVFALPNAKNWRVRCFRNAFPALKPEKAFKGIPGVGFGFHEVIVETPSETELFQDYDARQALLVFKAWKNRYAELLKKKGVKSVLLFKNHGKLAGASIPHEHSQIIAFPFIPPLLNREYFNFDWFKGNKKDFYEELVKKHSVVSNKSFALVVSENARFPNEFWVVCKKKKANLKELSDSEGLDLVKLLQFGVTRLWPFTQDYIFAFHQREEKDFRLHVEVYPRNNVWAGVEYGSGVIIRSSSPQQTRKLFT